VQQLSGPDAPRPPATAFLIPRNRPSLAFPAAAIVADVAVVAVGLRMKALRADRTSTAATLSALYVAMFVPSGATRSLWRRLLGR
jgi:hypothetical protein